MRIKYRFEFEYLNHYKSDGLNKKINPSDRVVIPRIQKSDNTYEYNLMSGYDETKSYKKIDYPYKQFEDVDNFKDRLKSLNINHNDYCIVARAPVLRSMMNIADGQQSESKFAIKKRKETLYIDFYINDDEAPPQPNLDLTVNERFYRGLQAENYLTEQSYEEIRCLVNTKIVDNATNKIMYDMLIEGEIDALKSHLPENHMPEKMSEFVEIKSSTSAIFKSQHLIKTYNQISIMGIDSVVHVWDKTPSN